jgi:hypothetical protein
MLFFDQLITETKRLIKNPVVKKSLILKTVFPVMKKYAYFRPA